MYPYSSIHAMVGAGAASFWLLYVSPSSPVSMNSTFQATKLRK